MCRTFATSSPASRHPARPKASRRSNFRTCSISFGRRAVRHDLPRAFLLSVAAWRWRRSSRRRACARSTSRSCRPMAARCAFSPAAPRPLIARAPRLGRPARQGARGRARPARRLSRLRAAGRGGQARLPGFSRAQARAEGKSRRRLWRRRQGQHVPQRLRRHESGHRLRLRPQHRPSRASCCPAAISRSSRRSARRRHGPTIWSSCRGTCSTRSRPNSGRIAHGAARLVVAVPQARVLAP